MQATPVWKSATLMCVHTSPTEGRLIACSRPPAYEANDPVPKCYCGNSVVCSGNLEGLRVALVGIGVRPGHECWRRFLVLPMACLFGSWFLSIMMGSLPAIVRATRRISFWIDWETSFCSTNIVTIITRLGHFPVRA